MYKANLLFPSSG